MLLDVLHRVADLHRAGVRAQQQLTALDVEGVVHRARRMVLRRVQRGEVEPVVLDLGTVGDVEAHRAEDRLDALHRARDRVQAAGAALAAGQRDVQRLGLELLVEFRVRQRLAARGQRGLDALLELVDLRAAGLLLLDGQAGHALHQLGDLAGLAQEAGLGVLQVSGSRGGGEIAGGLLQQLIEVVHRGAPTGGQASLAEIEWRRGEMANIAPRCRNEKRPNTGVSAFERDRAGQAGAVSPAAGEHPRTDLAIKPERPSPWRRCWQNQQDR